jgi:hypothetical protein
MMMMIGVCGQQMIGIPSSPAIERLLEQEQEEEEYGTRGMREREDS